jgi:nucleoside-diphosphate-sugar epimerase
MRVLIVGAAGMLGRKLAEAHALAPADGLGRVAGCPSDFDTGRARDLGFRAETSFEQIIRVHLEDELGGRPAGRTA